MSLPNLITICRLLLVPAVVYLILTGQVLAAFWLFVLAGISDGVDGYIAKRFDSHTELGAYLDPLADKALLVSIYVALGVMDELPLWLVMLVVSRDLFIVSAVVLSWMLSHPVQMSPHMVGKANTLGQIVLAAVVLADLGFALRLEPVREVLIVVIAVLTAASAAVYLAEWMRHMGGSGDKGDDGSDSGEGSP